MAKAITADTLARFVCNASIAIGQCPDEAGRVKAIRAMKGLLSHIRALEAALDECDNIDALGTEGWRHRLGID